MSESLSLMFTLMMAAGGMLGVMDSVRRIDDSVTVMHAAWTSEYVARMCAEREALRRNLLDAGMVIGTLLRNGRAQEQINTNVGELLDEVDVLWPLSSLIGERAGDENRVDSNDECVASHGATALVRKDGRELPGYPEPWPRWSVRWGAASISAKGDD